MGIQSIFTSTLRNPLPCAIIAGIATKITQMAISSVFRAPSQWVSLIARIEQLPGGQTLINYGPSVLMALIIGVLRLCRPAKLPYHPLHHAVDAHIQSETEHTCRSSMAGCGEGNWKGYFCSNYPKRDTAAHDTFCGAFGYAETDQVQVVAIADGYGWGRNSQRAARAMVDGFFEHMPFSSYSGASFEIVKNAALKSQKDMGKKHREGDPYNHYGETTFLGGTIGAHFFSYVSCGNWKLYHLNRGSFIEKSGLTASRLAPHGSFHDRICTVGFSVQPGDKLLFMSEAVHENLDTNPPEKGIEEEHGKAEERKLSILQQFAQVEDLGNHIMTFVYYRTEKYLNAMATQDMSKVSPKEFPGKPGHMTLLVVTVK
jgi:hypothetical protein